jgi:hypothetical protein
MAKLSGKQKAAETSSQRINRAGRDGRADGAPCGSDAPSFKFLTFDFAQKKASLPLT